MLEDEVDQSSLPEGADGLQGLTALRESPIFLLSQLFQSQTSKLHLNMSQNTRISIEHAQSNLRSNTADGKFMQIRCDKMTTRSLHLTYDVR